MQNQRTLPILAVIGGIAWAIPSLYDCVVSIASGRPHEAPVIAFAISSFVAVLGLVALRREDY